MIVTIISTKINLSKEIFFVLEVLLIHILDYMLAFESETKSVSQFFYFEYLISIIEYIIVYSDLTISSILSDFQRQHFHILFLLCTCFQQSLWTCRQGFTDRLKTRGNVKFYELVGSEIPACHLLIHQHLLHLFRCLRNLEKGCMQILSIKKDN